MGGKFFVSHAAVSYVVYLHWEGVLLFVLGVIKTKLGNPGPVILHLLLNTLIYNYSLLLPPIPTSWTFRFFTVISMIFHVD